MEQKLFVTSMHETNDMGIRNGSSNTISFPLSELKTGAKIKVGESWGQPDITDASYFVHLVWEIEVVELTEEKMVFDLKGDRFTLYRQWQVLGTMSYGIPNAMIHESKRFFFYFANDDKSQESQLDQLQKLYDQMSDNSGKGDYWKNIPLGKEALYVIKDVAPETDDEIKMQFCELVVDEELLDPLSTPRLLLSFMDFYHVMKHSDYQWNNEAYSLMRATLPNAGTGEIESYISRKSHLKYDPVQLSQQYEDCIYDVEKELDDLFKDEDRYMGFCHLYWSAKCNALAKRGIEWMSPQTMNPKTRFD